MTEPPQGAPGPAVPADPSREAPPEELPTGAEVSAGRQRMLLLSVLVVATCGLVYELIAATMASYLLGDSVTQWSLVIGVYLSAMGLGSWLSRFVEHRLAERFVQIQLVIAVVGGTSAVALFFGFAQLATVRPLLFSILVVVGTAVGLEIPLMMRIVRGLSLRDLVARVLAFDYLGSLAASLLFPLWLLPTLGLVRTSLLFGVFNGVVAWWTARAFAAELRRPAWVQAQAIAVTLALAVAFVGGKRLEAVGEAELYDSPVLFSMKSRYQRLTLTRERDDLRLYIDGNLQFSSIDEYRYHEALVHPAMAVAQKARPQAPDGRRVLVLGGGDGLALREILRHPGVAHVDLVDLDPAMTDLFRAHVVLAGLNAGALSDARVHVHNRDALDFIVEQERAGEEPYDVVVVDLPDPNNFSLGKLYSASFYARLRTRIRADGAAVVQATSPYLAPRSFWCIVRTLESVGLSALPYHAHVPSFGDWGFVLVGHAPRPVPTELVPEVPRRFLSNEVLPTLFVFPADQQPPEVDINRLNNQLLVHYYEQDLADPLVRSGR